jgi:bromodomain-containing factor 1
MEGKKRTDGRPLSSDYIALNIPQYPTLIKHPMDLGTIRTKLEQNKYPVPPYEAFEHDVRLIFKNCYVFNPPGTPVNDWGRRVEDVFERKWEERPLGDDDDYCETISSSSSSN